MQKVKGVNGVRVSLSEGLTTLELEPGNTVKLSDLKQVIKNNGFVSPEAQVIALGRLSTSNGQSIFEVAGTGERFTVVGRAPQPEPSLEITGRVEWSKTDQPRLSIVKSRIIAARASPAY